MYDNHVRTAVAGGCDLAQADAIARERTLYTVMRASAAIAYVRQRMATGNENVNRLFGFSEVYD